MENPYQAPKTVVTDDQSVSEKHSVTIALLLYAVPLLGFAIGAVFLTRAFGVFSEDSSADASLLSEKISRAMFAMALSLIPGLFGYAKIFYVILRDGYRGKRFFWTTITLSAFYCFLIFPIGLVTGGILLAVLLAKRAEFFSNREKANG
ncbi:hypothetical protein N9A89_00875 [Akkermansiaceae bacterium]|nr:hypothetical protein [Akkermansiaceae bacterium]